LLGSAAAGDGGYDSAKHGAWGPGERCHKSPQGRVENADGLTETRGDQGLVWLTDGRRDECASEGQVRQVGKWSRSAVRLRNNANAPFLFPRADAEGRKKRYSRQLPPYLINL